jgi:hypothetical protein
MVFIARVPKILDIQSSTIRCQNPKMERRLAINCHENLSLQLIIFPLFNDIFMPIGK